MSQHKSKQIERNHYYFSTLIDIVAFLAAYQLAFRGKIFGTFKTKNFFLKIYFCFGFRLAKQRN